MGPTAFGRPLQLLGGPTAFGGPYSFWWVLQLLVGPTAFGGSYSFWWALQLLVGPTAFGGPYSFGGSYSLGGSYSFWWVLQLLVGPTAFGGTYSFGGSYSLWWVLQLQLQLRRSFWTWRVGCVAEYFCSDTLNIITIVNFYSHYILVNSFEEVFGLGGWLVSGEGDEGDFNITDHMPFVTDTCNNEQDNQGEKIGCSLRRVETPKAGSWDCVRTLLETTETQRAQCKQTPLSTMVWMGA